MKKYLLLHFTVIVFLTGGCIKETYDMDKLSGEMHLSPTFIFPAAKGEITLDDILVANDTVVYDDDKLCRIIYRKDSVIDLRLKDYYDFDNIVDYDEVYTLGEVKIGNFQTSLDISLSRMSLLFPATLRNQLISLDDGALHFFPAFPSVTLAEMAFSPQLTNMDYATFASGAIDITVKNEINTSLYGLRIRLMNSSDHSPVGNEVVISSVPAGATVTGSVNLANQYVTKAISAVVTVNGSPGNTSPVLIDMDHSLKFTATARDLKVLNGRIILPPQLIEEGIKKDTITIDPGEGVEVEKLGLKGGNMNYTLQTGSYVKTSFTVTLPSVMQGGNAVSKTVILNPRSTSGGFVNLDNTVFDLSRDVNQKYNRVPVEYTINISSDNNLINFSSRDNIRAVLSLPHPDIDYVKGYFGQRIKTIGTTSLDIGMDRFFSKITGDFRISNPMVTINYSNSFGLPIEVRLNALGINDAETVALGREPFTLCYPGVEFTRDTTSAVFIDKNNSRLVELISMLPGEIRFSGTAQVNPGGDNGAMDNFVFGNSRIIADLNVDIPMELKISDLQFTETVDNFLDTGDPDDDQGIRPEDFHIMKINLSVSNGFPLGASVEMSLFDSERKINVSTVRAGDIIKPAPVDVNGRVTGPAESSAEIQFTEDFFNSIGKADEIVFKFIMKSTDNGTRDVKIYSDYNLTFNALVVITPEIRF